MEKNKTNCVLTLEDDRKYEQIFRHMSMKLSHNLNILEVLERLQKEENRLENRIDYIAELCLGKDTSTYRNIDMEKTGIKLKKVLENAGYTPVKIQKYLQLACVQPIYRWYKGIVLPTVNHLFMLSKLLDIHMEELLVEKDVVQTTISVRRKTTKTRLLALMAYYRMLLECNSSAEGRTVTLD